MQNVYTIFIPATPYQYRTQVSLIGLIFTLDITICKTCITFLFLQPRLNIEQRSV